MANDIKREGAQLTVTVRGKLDANSSPKLEESLTPELDGIESLTIDLSEVDYVSSMGLRLLLALQKRMSKQGSMQVAGVSGFVAELFDETGFSDILTLV